MENHFKKVKANSIIICCIIGITIFHIHYLIVSTRNVPIMDYWRYLSTLGEKITTGDFSILDAWTIDAYKGYRNLIVPGLLYLNIKYFHYNIQLEIFGGVLFSLLTSISLIYIFVKENKNRNKTAVQLLSVSFLLCTFNLNQWEILTLGFSLSFMIRIFCFVLTFIWLNEILLDIKTYKQKILKIMFFIIALCTISQLYLIAFYGSIGLTIIVHFCINYKRRKAQYLKCYLLVMLGIIIGIIIYFKNLNFSLTATKNTSIGVILLHLISSTLLMLGSSVLNFFYEARRFTPLQMYIGGTIIALSYVFALFLYFKKKLYKKTYIPLFLILYCFGNIAAISYGRASLFNLYYVTASRYTCETTLGLIGVLWILAHEMLTITKVPARSKIYKFIMVSMSFTVIVGSLLFSLYKENQTGYFRGIYFDNVKNMMFTIERHSDEDLNGGGYQGSPENIRNATNFLAKNNLGIFYQNNEQNKPVFYGFYGEDTTTEVWTDGNASITVKNQKAESFKLTGYSPDYMPLNRLVVTINNNETEAVEMIPGKSYTVTLEFENTSGLIDITLKTDKSFRPKDEGWGQDGRLLGAFIVSWSLE